MKSKPSYWFFTVQEATLNTAYNRMQLYQSPAGSLEESHTTRTVKNDMQTQVPILHGIPQLLQISLRINIKGTDNLLGKNEQVAKKLNFIYCLVNNTLIPQMNSLGAICTPFLWHSKLISYPADRIQPLNPDKVCHTRGEEIGQQSRNTHLSHF